MSQLPWYEEIVADLKLLNVDLTKFNEKAFIAQMQDSNQYECPLYCGAVCNLFKDSTNLDLPCDCNHCSHFDLEPVARSNTDFKCTASKEHTNFVQKWHNFFRF